MSDTPAGERSKTNTVATFASFTPRPVTLADYFRWFVFGKGGLFALFNMTPQPLIYTGE